MIKMGSGRLIMVIFCLLLVTLACNAPIGSVSTPSAEEQTSPEETVPANQPAGPAPGYQEIEPGQVAELGTADGASLTIPAGSYDAATAVSMQARPDSSLPQTTNLHHLISTPYELDQDGYAGQVSPLTLSIPYDPAVLPEGVSPQALTIVWWDGESWQDVPSMVDETQGLIQAEIHHFSTYAAAWSRFEEMAGGEGYFDDGQVYGQFTIHYTTRDPAEQSGFWPWSSTATDDRPSLEDADEDAVPDQVQQLGDDLLFSRTFFIDLLAAQGLSYPGDSPIDVYIAEVEPAAGFFNPATNRLVFDNNRADKTTIAHELFHYIQHSLLTRQRTAPYRWWIEASAEWAEDQVFDDLNAYYGPIRLYKPNPARDGFGGLHSRGYNEYYAASSLVQYLEMRYPGFVLATFNPTIGLSNGKSWHGEFGRILSSNYGAQFDEVIEDYFVSYYYHWDFDVDMPFVFDISDPALLADSLLVAGPGMYTRVSQALPPISGRLVSVEAAGNLEKAKLVVAEGGTGQTPFVYAFADNIAFNLHTRVALPGSSDRLGVLLGAADPWLVIDDFGSADDDQSATQVNLVVTNMLANAVLGLDLEIYLLQPPDNVLVENEDADSLRINWEPSQLPVGDSPGDDGALAGYRLYRQVNDQPPELLAEIDPAEVSYDLGREQLDLQAGSVALFMRSVDKYENESSDSESLNFGASLVLESISSAESNCFISSVNDWEFCDVTLNATFHYSAAGAPATISCSLASTSEGATVVVQETSGTVQLQIVDEVINMENRGTYPVFLCNLEPGDVQFRRPYNFGTYQVVE